MPNATPVDKDKRCSPRIFVIFSNVRQLTKADCAGLLETIERGRNGEHHLWENLGDSPLARRRIMWTSPMDTAVRFTTTPFARPHHAKLMVSPLFRKSRRSSALASALP